MNEPHGSLESLLSKAPHIDDDGFTEALMTRLPASHPSLRMRTTVMLAATLTSCSIVVAIPGARRFLAEFSAGFVGGSAATGSSLFAAGIVVALVVWGAMAAASSEA